MFGHGHMPGVVPIPTAPVAYYRSPTPTESPVFPSPPSRGGELPFIPPDLGPPRHYFPRVYQPPIPPEFGELYIPPEPSDASIAPSPPANARRRPRSSKFFDRIKFSFPRRPARPVPPSHATAGSVPQPSFSPIIVQSLPPTIVQSSPPTDVQRKPRSSKIFNRIRYAFTTRPPPTLPRTPSPLYPMRPTIINAPSQPGVETQYRSPSPTFSHRRYTSRAPALSRTSSTPYPPNHTVVNIPPRPGLVAQKVPLHSPSPHYPPSTSPFIPTALSPHPLSQPVQSSGDRTTSISSLRTHQGPEEAPFLESL